MHKWFVYKTFDEASKAAADFIATRIQASIQKNDICHVILPGGNTPADCLSHLAKKNLPWNKIHWYPGDERCYPAGHVDRNDVMLEKNLWSHLADTHIHKIPAELGAEEGARVYRDVISAVDKFDIAFLGMGEDGHSASLFPENEALDDSRSVVAVYHSPKAPAERVSLSINTLKNAQCRLVLTAGATMADILARIKKGESLPIKNLGDINWYVDEAAVNDRQEN